MGARLVGLIATIVLARHYKPSQRNARQVQRQACKGSYRYQQRTAFRNVGIMCLCGAAVLCVHSRPILLVDLSRESGLLFRAPPSGPGDEGLIHSV